MKTKHAPEAVSGNVKEIIIPQEQKEEILNVLRVC